MLSQSAQKSYPSVCLTAASSATSMSQNSLPVVLLVSVDLLQVALPLRGKCPLGTRFPPSSPLRRGAMKVGGAGREQHALLRSAQQDEAKSYPSVASRQLPSAEGSQEVGGAGREQHALLRSAHHAEPKRSKKLPLSLPDGSQLCNLNVAELPAGRSARFG